MQRKVSINRMYAAADALIGIIPPPEAAEAGGDVWACDPLYVFAATGLMFRKSELRSGLNLLVRLGMAERPAMPGRESSACEW